LDNLHIQRQHHLKVKIYVFIVRTGFKYSMLTEINDPTVIGLFDSVVFDDNYIKAGGTFSTLSGMPYKPYSYLMELYVRCFRDLTIFSVGNPTAIDKLSTNVMTNLDKKYNQCYKTPSLLVNAMLDRLPADVWVNPEKTFFDPFCGTGEFLVQVQKRLMKTLVEVPEKERIDHINNNMLYFNDINNSWTEWTKFRLGGGNGFNENFLDWEPDMKFDAVLGNPPFQGDSDNNQNKIYNQFSKKALVMTNDTGCLAFVTPIPVLKKSKRFSVVGVDGLKVVDFRANNYFEVGTTICWWLIDKKYTGEVEVLHNAGSEAIVSGTQIYDYSKTDKHFINLYETLKLVTDTPAKRMFKQNNFGPALSKNQDSVHPYPLYKLTSGGSVLTCFSSRLPYLLGSNKFIISRTKSFDVDSTIICNKDYDTAHMFTDVANDDEINNIKSFLFCDYFINHSKKWKELDGYGFNDCLKYIPPFDKTKSWDSDSVKQFLEGFL
jgi:hypothetical protein